MYYNTCQTDWNNAWWKQNRLLISTTHLITSRSESSQSAVTCFGPLPPSVPSDAIVSGCPVHVDMTAAHRSRIPVCTIVHALLGRHAHGSAAWTPVTASKILLTLDAQANRPTRPNPLVCRLGAIYGVSYCQDDSNFMLCALVMTPDVVVSNA